MAPSRTHTSGPVLKHTRAGGTATCVGGSKQKGDGHVAAPSGSHMSVPVVNRGSADDTPPSVNENDACDD